MRDRCHAHDTLHRCCGNHWNEGCPSKVPASDDHGILYLGSPTAWQDVQRHLISVWGKVDLYQQAPIRSCLQCFRIEERHPARRYRSSSYRILQAESFCESSGKPI